jgi:hypothetical protein
MTNENLLALPPSRPLGKLLVALIVLAFTSTAVAWAPACAVETLREGGSRWALIPFGLVPLAFVALGLLLVFDIAWSWLGHESLEVRDDTLIWLRKLPAWRCEVRVHLRDVFRARVSERPFRSRGQRYHERRIVVQLRDRELHLWRLLSAADAERADAWLDRRLLRSA